MVALLLDMVSAQQPASFAIRLHKIQPADMQLASLTCMCAGKKRKKP